MQNDFVASDGALPVPGAGYLIDIINGIMKNSKLPIIVTQDWHPPNHSSFESWKPHCVQNTPGAEIVSGFEFPTAPYVLQKGTQQDDDGYSAINGTIDGVPLVEWLRMKKIDGLFVCGVTTEYCVRSTVTDLLDNGFTVIVVENAIAGLDPVEVENAIFQMRSNNAIFMTSYNS